MGAMDIGFRVNRTDLFNNMFLKDLLICAISGKDCGIALNKHGITITIV